MDIAVIYDLHLNFVAHQTFYLAVFCNKNLNILVCVVIFIFQIIEKNRN